MQHCEGNPIKIGVRQDQIKILRNGNSHDDQLHSLERERGLYEDTEDGEEAIETDMVGLQTERGNCSWVLPVLSNHDRVSP